MSVKETYLDLLSQNADLDDFEYWLKLIAVEAIFYEEE